MDRIEAPFVRLDEPDPEVAWRERLGELVQSVGPPREAVFGEPGVDRLWDALAYVARASGPARRGPDLGRS